MNGCKRCAELKEAVLSLVVEFASWSESSGGFWTCGLSALEEAFGVLGWDDPHSDPEYRCDEPGCMAHAEFGTKTADGYRKTCMKHLPERPKGESQ